VVRRTTTLVIADGRRKENPLKFGHDCFGNDETRMTNVEGMTKIRSGSGSDLLRKGCTLAHCLF
jgi:hypothetical protein